MVVSADQSTTMKEEPVPSSLIFFFFKEATDALDQCEPEPRQNFKAVPPPLSRHRKRLLQLQKTTLDRVVSDYNEAHTTSWTVQNVQSALRHLTDEVQSANQSFNKAARHAFCRLVLYEECRVSDTVQRPLNTTAPLTRSDLLEYSGLCNTAVQLPNVQQHLAAGTPLFEDLSSSDNVPLFPQKRLEIIQRKLLRAIGFDPNHGKQELERLYFTQEEEENDDSEQREVRALLDKLSSNMSVALTKADLDASPSTTLLSDEGEGGYTRVVSVNYSEKIVDYSSSGAELSSSCSTAAPTSETISEQMEQEQRKQLKMARQAASLQQSMIGELLALPEEEREARLARAQEAHDEFVKRVDDLPLGPERVAFLTSMNPETQRLLAIHKLWNSTQQQR